MSTNLDPNSFLMGGGRSASLKEPGDKVSGEIVDMAIVQQTDYVTKEPKFWGNGDPMMQLVVTLETDLSEDPQDDGQRRVYLKGGRKPTASQGAVAAAVKAAGASKLEKGGRLSIGVTGIGQPSAPGLNPPKEFAAKYEPPAAGVNPDDIFGS